MHETIRLFVICNDEYVTNVANVYFVFYLIGKGKIVFFKPLSKGI